MQQTAPATGAAPDEAHSHPWSWWSGLPALAIAVPLLAMGIATTRDLRWPSDPDLYRDIAQAQTIADGALFADPHYRDEKAWHNPLLPAIVALSARVSGWPVHVAYVRLGSYVNVLAPIAFYIWVWRLSGVAGATAATVGFVFYKETWAPNWVTAAYSPWLFSMTASQPFLYASLAAFHAAIARGGRRLYGLVGLLAGLTFLAAAPPALMVAGVAVAVVLAVAVRAWWTGRGPTPARGADIVLMAAVAAAVAAPFLYTIVGHYQLQVRNAIPTLWEWGGLEKLDPQGPWRWPRIAAVCGLVALLARARRRLEAMLAASYLLAAAAFLAHRPALALLGLPFPKLVPSHYFVFYLQAGQWMLIGVLVDLLVAWPSRIAARRLPWLASPPAAAGLAAVLAAAAAALALPGYAQRGYFDSARRGAMEEDARVHVNAAFQWMRRHASPDDVFLAPESLVLRAVGPAGRKAILIAQVFSNPYVDWEQRRQAMGGMYDALARRDGRRFGALAHEFRVTYILSARAEQAWLDDLLETEPPPGAVCSFRSGGVKIWRLASHTLPEG
jgi:hypothetical protein